MALQSINLEHLPAGYTIHAALYRDVKNAAFLHQQLLAGNTDFEYALIDATVIVSRLHALAAAYRAVNDLVENRLSSRNVHSEMVFSLSPNNNIAESFRRFGITPQTTNLLIIKVSTPNAPFAASSVQEHLTTSVEGEQVEFSDEILQGMTDMIKVKKYYKLNTGTPRGGKSGKGIVGGVGSLAVKEGGEAKEFEMLILGSIALRGAT